MITPQDEWIVILTGVSVVNMKLTADLMHKMKDLNKKYKKKEQNNVKHSTNK